MPFVSCSKFNQSQATQDQAIADLAQELLTKQNALNDCSGNPLAGTVPTCADLSEALSQKQGVLLGCNGVALPANTKVATCIDLNSKADLVDGKVPASQLPSYVDDVLEFPKLASFPATGEAGKIYIDASTNKTYRWNGAGYTEIGASAGITVQDEGSVLTTAATSLNFIGTAITATSAGGAVSVGVDAVTPAQMATTLANYADTNTATGNALVPTGNPAGNGTNYATNANGELFIYNTVTGQWQLISMGYLMGSASTKTVTIPANQQVHVVASFIMPRKGGIQLSAFTLCGSETDSFCESNTMSIELTATVNDILACHSDFKSSYLVDAAFGNSFPGCAGVVTGGPPLPGSTTFADETFGNSLAGYVDVNKGDELKVSLIMRNLFGHDVRLDRHNIKLYYVS